VEGYVALKESEWEYFKDKSIEEELAMLVSHY
jgi:hypothetical protein